MISFDTWLETLSAGDIAAYLYDVYLSDIVEEDTIPDNTSITFHIDSIMNYDDKEVAQISLNILRSIDKKLITTKIKNRCKILGIK